MSPPPHREFPEFLDTPGQDPQELWGLLQDIRRTNHRFGGRRLILNYLRRLLPALPARPLRLLDVATASADIPCAIAAWARASGVAVDITALDMSADILAHAAIAQGISALAVATSSRRSGRAGSAGRNCRR